MNARLSVEEENGRDPPGKERMPVRAYKAGLLPRPAQLSSSCILSTSVSEVMENEVGISTQNSNSVYAFVT